MLLRAVQERPTSLCERQQEKGEADSRKEERMARRVWRAEERAGGEGHEIIRTTGEKGKGGKAMKDPLLASG